MPQLLPVYMGHTDTQVGHWRRCEPLMLKLNHNQVVFSSKKIRLTSSCLLICVRQDYRLSFEQNCNDKNSNFEHHLGFLRCFIDEPKQRRDVWRTRPFWCEYFFLRVYHPHFKRWRWHSMNRTEKIFSSKRWKKKKKKKKHNVKKTWMIKIQASIFFILMKVSAWVLRSKMQENVEKNQDNTERGDGLEEKKKTRWPRIFLVFL